MNKICGVNGLEQFFEQRLLCVVADADNDAFSYFKSVNGLAEPEVFRRAGKMKLRKFLFQPGAGTNGQLRGNQHQRALGQVRQRVAEIGEDEVRVRLVVFVDRRVVTKPEHVGVGAGDFGVGREGKFLRGKSGGNEFIQPRFEQGRLTGIESGNVRLVEIEPDDPEMPRATCSGDASEVPEA